MSAIKQKIAFLRTQFVTRHGVFRVIPTKSASLTKALTYGKQDVDHRRCGL